MNIHERFTVLRNRRKLSMDCARRAKAAGRNDLAGAWVRIAKGHSRKARAALMWAALGLLAGCAQLRPIAEGGHLSVATQHIDGSGNNYGCNYLGGGLRWKPHPRMQVDALETYSYERCFGKYHERFDLRVNWEF